MVCSLHFLHSTSKNLLFGFGTNFFVDFISQPSLQPFHYQSFYRFALSFVVFGLKLKFFHAETRPLYVFFTAFCAFEPKVYALGRLFTAFWVFFWKTVIPFHLTQESSLAMCDLSSCPSLCLFDGMLSMLFAIRAKSAHFLRVHHMNPSCFSLLLLTKLFVKLLNILSLYSFYFPVLQKFFIKILY